MVFTGKLSGPGGWPGSGPLAALFVAAAACSPTIADIPHNDDVIVDGSMNVGLDSQLNRGFGFDTMIFSENNLRVLFEDTSSSASFPTNDWRIVINDSSNGGDNYFGVQDVTGGRDPFRIEAGAPSHSLFVESTGDVGLGTNNPVVNLHMADGNTPTVRLEQNGTSGFASQTWDLASNETNFFIRDATNGSTLPFRIRPGAPTSSIDVAADGNVGIGIANATAKLHVEGDAFISETLEIGSSRERKEKIREITFDEALGALEELQPVEFHYKQDPESQLGFIAEDVPEIVATKGRRSVRPMDFVAVLAKVVQEHARRERELTETIGSQQREIERLAERLSALEDAAPPDTSADRAPGR